MKTEIKKQSQRCRSSLSTALPGLVRAPHLKDTLRPCLVEVGSENTCILLPSRNQHQDSSKRIGCETGVENLRYLLPKILLKTVDQIP